VSGIQNFGGNIGGVLAPAVTGYVAHTQSFAMALTIAGGMLVLGIFSYVVLIGTKAQDDELDFSTAGALHKV